MARLFPDALLACIREGRDPAEAEIEEMAHRIDADIYGLAAAPLPPLWHGRTKENLMRLAQLALSGDAGHADRARDSEAPDARGRQRRRSSLATVLYAAPLREAEPALEPSF